MTYEALTLLGAVGLAWLYVTRPPSLFIALLLLVGTTRAQPIDATQAAGRAGRDVDTARIAARTEPAVLLARMAWLEAGARVTQGEVAAMHEVITTRMRGSYQRTAYAYSAGLRNPRRLSVYRLGRAPLGRGWPAMHREHWPRVLAAADAAVAGTLTHGCETGGRPLEHWGGGYVDRESIAALTRRGYEVVECPGYANTFLVRSHDAP